MKSNSSGKNEQGLFLGLDCSTQSLTAVLIDLEHQKIVYQNSLNYDQEFPWYKTKNGTLSNSDPLIVHSSPLLWAEALDQSFQVMKNEGIPLEKIRAIGGSAQQHGSVYFSHRAGHTLANLNPSHPLKENIKDLFSRPTAPIWMDFSTTKECQEIRSSLGGVRATVECTGSNTFERFTGPQIRKFYKTEPQLYEHTVTIALVSSYMASLLSGTIAPIDYGDASGMNLMDIRKKIWHRAALQATAPNLLEKLPSLVPSSQFIGQISPYFVSKYGFSSQTQIQVWSGDNLNSAIGLGLIKEGKFCISLGTSDTYFGIIKEWHIDPKGEGNLFLSPTGEYLPLICFQNGSLAREKLRALYELSWDQFSEFLEKTPIGNRGALMLPYFFPEIVPHVSHPHVYRHLLNPQDAPANCRAIIEAQMLSMRIHSEWMERTPTQLIATGGASVNTAILQIMADVFQCSVTRIEIPHSAALGAALRAAQGLHPTTPWEHFLFATPTSRITPNLHAAPIYDRLATRYAEFEQMHVGNRSKTT